MTLAISPRPMRGSLAAVALLALGLVSGCSTIESGYNSTLGKLFNSDKPKAKELEPITAPITVRSVWSQSVGAVQFPLTVAVNGNTLTLASTGGDVVALDAASGKTIWRVGVGAKIAAGVGSDGKVSSVVTRDGDLVVIEDGKVKWKKALGVRVATAPLVAGGRVFVLGVDRAIQAFDANDGVKLWQVARPGDPLTLSQTGVITAFRNTLVAGQGPRMAGFDPVGPSLRWEVPLGSPRGANEVERLADLVGPVLRTGDLICARSFQAAIGCVDAQLGTVAWTKAIGGTDAIGGDAEYIYSADASDRMSAFKTATGEVAWTSEALMFRSLGAPGVVGQSVVFGDGSGMLHWISRAKGESQARVQTDGSAITVPPVNVGGVLVVVTRSGGVFAFRPS